MLVVHCPPMTRDLCKIQWTWVDVKRKWCLALLGRQIDWSTEQTWCLLCEDALETNLNGLVRCTGTTLDSLCEALVGSLCEDGQQMGVGFKVTVEGITHGGQKVECPRARFALRFALFNSKRSSTLPGSMPLNQNNNVVQS